MKSIENNVISFVKKNAENRKKDIAFIYPDLYNGGEFFEITNGEFYKKVLKFASVLKKMGVKKEERIIIFLPISVELYIALAGLQIIGAIPVFLESWSESNHIKASIDNSNPVGIISFSKIIDRYSDFFDDFKIRISIDNKKSYEKINYFYYELLSSNTSDEKKIDIEMVSLKDTALITYTTGSSGVPKGANRTHEFLKSQHYALNKIFPYSDGDIDMPIFPVFALNNLASGVTTVIPMILSSDNLKDEDIKKLIFQISKLKINNLTLSPVIFNKLTKYAKKNNLIFPKIKRVLTGGAPVSENDIREFKKIVPNSKIWILYGSTEVEPISYIESSDMLKIMESVEFNNSNKTSQGVVVGDVHMDLDIALIDINFNDFKIKRVDEIKVVKNKVGELIVSGKHVCESYYNNNEAFKKAKIVEVNTGKIWHRTGDIARIDKNKKLWIVGRKHNVILKKNEMYFPVRPEILLKEITDMETVAYMQVNDDIFIVLEQKVEIEQKNNIIFEIENKFNKEKIPFDKIIFVDKIIMDIRHHSKVNYSEMKKKIEEVIKKKNAKIK